jgi:hypothetical protein
MNRPAVDLNHHRRLRAVLTRHQNLAVTTVPRTALRKWAGAFGLLEGNTLQLDSDGELTILFDFLVYHHRQRGKSLVQKYLAALPPTDDPDETLVRRAMAAPRFSMFEIAESHSFTGVTVRDRVRGGTLFVVDEALSTSAKPGQVLALRLLPLPDYHMTSGAGFPLSLGVVRTVEQVFLPVLRTTVKAPADLPPPAEDELAAVVVGAAMKEGTTGDIEFT